MNGYYMNTEKNVGIQVPANSAVAFRIVSLDITGFEGQKFLNICWRYHRFHHNPL